MSSYHDLWVALSSFLWAVAPQCDQENFNTSVVVRELEELLHKLSYAANAIEVSHIVKKEDGTPKASDLIEILL